MAVRLPRNDVDLASSATLDKFSMKPVACKVDPEIRLRDGLISYPIKTLLQAIREKFLDFFVIFCHHPF